MIAFDQYQDDLFSLAYRMLGTVSDAEDIVQEAFLRWQRVEPSTVDSPRAYLTSIATRLCIDHLRSARKQRETYIGPWLPEPIASASFEQPEYPVELAESLRVAFLMVLEHLSPTERAVFLLHDVFDYAYAEVATIVGKSEANCRQIARRARQHLKQHRPRFDANEQEQTQLVQHFLVAVQEGDLEGLMRLLAPDAVLYSDGGGKAIAARKPIEGAYKIAHFFITTARKAGEQVQAQPLVINGTAGAFIYEAGHLTTTITAQVEDGRIQALYTVRNPDKLGHLGGV